MALSDNNKKLWNKQLDGIKVVEPSLINTINFDKILILVGRGYGNLIKKQLIEYGIEKGNIWFWWEYKAYIYKDTYKKICIQKNIYAKSVAIIMQEMEYSGAPVVVINTINALKSIGYGVTLFTPKIDIEMVKELEKYDVTIIEMPALPVINRTLLSFFKSYDCIIVNSFIMALSAVLLNKSMHVILWLHEDSTVYERFKLEYEIYEDKLKDIYIIAVSRNCAEKFRKFYPNIEVNAIMEYGLNDITVSNKKDNDNRGIKIAVVGKYCELKSQDTVLRAVRNLKENKDKISIYLIGDISENERLELQHKYFDIKIIFTGILNREEIYKLYNKIDIIICSSKRETMSLAITEGMMFGKVCIMTKTTGMSDYVINEENGFVYDYGNYAELSELLNDIMNNKYNLESIKKQARQTYEDNFTINKLAERLEKNIIKQL